MSVETLFLFLDFGGIALFAFSGGMLAARKALDPFGAAILGAVTGMGGGTLRDVLLGTLPVYWVEAPVYLWVALGGALAGYYSSGWAQAVANRRVVLVWADAVGMSAFCVIGAQAGLEAGAHWTIALLTGVMSAAFGGLIRDIIVNDVPLVLREDVYALAALAGAAAYVAALALGIGPSFAAVGGALIAFVLRGCAIQFKWSLPPIGKV
ncbi:trimeric intracellular cation channel family protein [Hyphobacterium sp. SN044]|uniref:trimeric intracellular cation channel family protein n=1 Tax=Hyphobacterium sp. SN044 TaxID=2912575 RepID=UPI001F3634A2|nr:trimeric intracellular cation channel family protein [Hyphobacterium sp. SN044]MCF8878934.1 trimeric intracellular cation channel family protein [Hyphobacterium sp. SN044]